MSFMKEIADEHVMRDQPTADMLEESIEHVVMVRDVKKRYGQVQALNGMSFAIRRGEIFGLLGPNGAGKSTILEIIEGIRSQDQGTISVLGMDVRRQRRQVQEQIGVQLQATTLFPNLNVRETIGLFSSFYPRPVPVEQLLQTVALQEKAGAQPEELSGGQRQRLALALALVNDPALLFLDEPTSGLDPQSRHALWETVESLRDQGKTIVLTTHFMDEAQRLCDRIAIVDHGRVIAQDTVAGLLALLGVSAMIECAQGNAHGASLPPEELRSLPAVTEVQQGLEHTLIYTDNSEQTLIALLRLSTSLGVPLERLQLHAPTLEDVFLKLTGRQLRE